MKNEGTGHLNNVVDIEQEDPNKNTSWKGEPRWKAVFRNVRCEIKSVGGGERIWGLQMEAGITSAVRMHYHDGVSAKMRLNKQGRLLNIVRAADPDGIRKWLICQCQEVSA